MTVNDDRKYKEASKLVYAEGHKDSKLLGLKKELAGRILWIAITASKK